MHQRPIPSDPLLSALAMLSVLSKTWALMIGILLLMIGNGLQGSLLGVRGSIEQIDPSLMGYIMSGYFVGFLGGSWVTPALLRNVGHIRVFAAYGSLVSAAFILYAAFVDPFFWFGMRVVVGFCFSGLYVVAESWINDLSDNRNRGQALSLYVLIQMLGVVTGQFLLNVADPAGYNLFVLISVLVSISFAPILLTVTPMPVFSTAKPMSISALFKASPLGCVGVLLLGGIFSAFFGMASVYGTQRGLSVGEISIFLSAIYIGGLLMQYPVGWLSDRIDRRLLIVGMTGIAAVASAIGALSGDGFNLLMVIAFTVGAFTNPLYALLLAHTNDHLDADQMASASGGLIFINGFGAMTGPVIVGYLLDLVGPPGFFWYIALLSILISGYTLFRMTRRQAVEETNPYVPVTATASAVAVEIAIEVAGEDVVEEPEADDSPHNDQ